MRKTPAYDSVILAERSEVLRTAVISLRGCYCPAQQRAQSKDLADLTRTGRNEWGLSRCVAGSPPLREEVLPEATSRYKEATWILRLRLDEDDREKELSARLCSG